MIVPAGSRIYISAVLFLAGVVVVQTAPYLPSLWLLMVLPLAIGILRTRFLFPLAIFLIGCAWAVFRAELQLKQALPHELERKDVQIEAQVISLVHRDERYLKFTVDVESLKHAGVFHTPPVKVQLRWYDTKADVRIGQRWRFTARLRRPHGFQNPGGFDFERWLFRNGIRATGYVRRAHLVKTSNHAPWWGRFRETVSEHLVRTRLTHSGLLRALAVGERTGVDKEQWAVLQRTGTTHLLAISGLHIGIVSGFCFCIGLLFARLFGVLVQWIPAFRIAVIPAISGAVVYALLAGFTVPTQRAVIMVVVFMFGLAVNRTAPLLRSLALALFAVLILDPLSTLDTGFWLSFGALISIILAMTASTRVSSKILRIVIIQLLLTVIMAPMVLYFFGQVSICSPVANMIAIPLVGFVAVPLILSGSLALSLGWEWVANLGYRLADQVLGVVWNLLSVLSESPWAVWPYVPGHLITIFGMGTLLMIWLPKRYFRYPLLGVSATGLLLAVQLSGPSQVSEEGEYRVTVLDVGQGLSILVQTRSHTLLYDSGARFSRNFDAGSAVVVPHLRFRGVDLIDTLVVSHGDNDHIGGLGAILDGVEVGRRLTSVTDRVPRAEPCLVGQTWQWDGVFFSVLSPDVVDPPRHNNSSCVIKVQGPYGSTLLTGDIEKEVEHKLVRESPLALRSDILVIPHQGSRTSSTEEFIEAVDPRTAVVSAGYLNQYGHPAEDVIARYSRRGIEPFNTATGGAISIDVTRDGTGIGVYRRTHRRYWFGT